MYQNRPYSYAVDLRLASTSPQVDPHARAARTGSTKHASRTLHDHDGSLAKFRSEVITRESGFNVAAVTRCCCLLRHTHTKSLPEKEPGRNVTRVLDKVNMKTVFFLHRHRVDGHEKTPGQGHSIAFTRRRERRGSSSSGEKPHHLLVQYAAFQDTLRAFDGGPRGRVIAIERGRKALMKE